MFQQPNAVSSLTNLELDRFVCLFILLKIKALTKPNPNLNLNPVIRLIQTKSYLNRSCGGNTLKQAHTHKPTTIKKSVYYQIGN